MTISTRRSALIFLALAAFVTPACHQKMAVQPSYHPLEPSDFFADGRSSRPVVPGTVARGQLRIDHALFEGTDSAGKPVTEFPFEMTKEVLERGQERYKVFCSICHGLTGHGDGRIVQRGFTVPTSYLYQVNNKGVLTNYDDQPLAIKFKDGRPAPADATGKDVELRTFTFKELTALQDAVEDIKKRYPNDPQAKIRPLWALSRGYKRLDEKMTLAEAPVGYIYQVITKGYGAMASHAEQIPVKDRWAIVGYVRALQYAQLPELRKTMKLSPKGENK